ncbi:uncharacterized protein BX664DRAFT_327222 [Halteromyces radiatus]|uniref:uncharacterized protein n=1 Tax=Halteromyces radiatus TaxID=101107 RepID=UPI00221E409B|nr:uncharacterized protein BX664DRAFT_327222 [Halteromyces radiatus]KAI8097770.1 hypothetical protein BX664DRAFT_327222 [Halteromyces radiatus]
MNLVASSNVPPHIESPTWFKRLLSRWPRKRDTATSIAAATEKYIRHTSTIQCENLTAKEFAHLTGIHLKDEEEDDDNYSQTTRSALLHVHTPTATIRSSRTTASCKKPRIWDQDFWQHQQKSSHLSRTNTVSSSSTPATSNTTESSSSSSHHTTLSAISGFSSMCSATTTLTTCSGHEAFLTQLRRKSTQLSSYSIDGRPCSVIQKGRFKIVVGDHPNQEDDAIVGQEQQSDPVIVTPPVLEWKRKRSQEASCTTLSDEPTLCKD